MRAVRKKRGSRRHVIPSQRTRSPGGENAGHNQNLGFETLASKYSNVRPTAPTSRDFFLFPTPKNVQRGEHFNDVDGQDAISEINGDSLFNSSLSWVKHCKKCVSFNGEFFEMDYLCVLNNTRTRVKRDFVMALGRFNWNYLRNTCNFVIKFYRLIDILCIR
jgi:hypothetical protein